MLKELIRAAAFAALFGIVWVGVFYGNRAIGNSYYPSVRELESALNLSPGAQLPRDVQAHSGTIFHAYYLKGVSLGNGEYSVVVKLKR